MKILITGINGLVGNSLYKLLKNSGHELFYSSRNLEGLANYKVDISEKDEVDSFFKLENKILRELIGEILISLSPK